MTNFSKKAFREYDIRGVVGTDITTDLAYYIGRAFASEVLETGGQKICVGRDGRPSSPQLSKSLIQGLIETGLDVYTLEVGPSPMTYFAAHTLSMDAAIMVTGSHNPGDQNGFKMILKGGSFWGQQVQKLYERIATNTLAPLTSLGRLQETRIFDAYVSYLAKSYHDFYKDKRPLRVAWDPGNGAAGEVVAALVQRLPGEHFVIHDTIDGTFPAHHPDPTVAQNLVDLQNLVLDKQCDLGVAFDGDGDRLGVVDGSGKILWGDEFLILLAEEVLKDRPGAPIIADVKASQSFFQAVQQAGGTPVMWKTGHSLIKSKMKETGAPLAGEMSGHIFYADRYFGFDDGMYAALRLIGICASREYSLSDWNCQRPTRFNTPEIRFSCDGYDKFAIVQDVTEALKQANITIDLTDGVRVVTQEGWWLLRASNTQDVLVIRAESTTQKGLETLVGTLKKYLSPFGFVPPSFEVSSFVPVGVAS